MIKLFNDDNLEVLSDMMSCSIDAVVTDPPYGINFMCKKWDIQCPSVKLWRKCWQVLKPGGHLLAFSGTRNIDFIMGRIRHAGFEIRDTITWLYGSGFPKSLNISKAIDKSKGAKRKVIGYGDTIPVQSGGRLAPKSALNMKSSDLFERRLQEFTISATHEAKKWDGWGTGLKPACELIVLARRSIEGNIIDPDEASVVKNVLRHGTGVINIDECRIGIKDNVSCKSRGRWPANLILSHHPECKQVGWKEVKGSAPKEHDKRENKNKSMFIDGVHTPENSYGTETVEDWNCHEDCAVRMFDEQSTLYGRSAGDVSRFFYCAKASGRERGEDNIHPTVKPLKLMTYLCSLITPPNGIILDPFMGSGTTGVAAKKLGFGFIGIEINKDYFKIAKERIGCIE